MADDTRMLMCPENLHEGMKLGPITYKIKPEQIARFAGATGLGQLAGRDIDSEISPPTMRLQDYALLVAKHFYGGSGGVHAKHRNEFFAPMRAGQNVVTEGHISRIWRARGKFYFELEYESRDADTNQLLVRQAITSVLLQDGKMQ
jgi:hypothetical protein